MISIWVSHEATKTQIAQEYGVSTRTVTRVLDECEDQAERTEDDLFGEDLESDERFLFLDNWEDVEELFVPAEEIEYHFIATPDSLNITKVADGDYIGQVNADRDHPRFDEASNIVWGARGSQEALEQAFEILDQKTFIEKMSFGRITVDPEQNRVFYTDAGYEVDFHGRLVPRLIEALSDEEDQGLEGLLEFTDRLSRNPSNRAVNELYDFLEASDIKIDDDGMVVCFKKVRGNYTDIHSGKFDNSPGAVNQVPRNMVDEDSDRTCSYGLHVCSKSYLPHFGWSPDCRVVEVVVDPADFVAIPKDYNNAKARVSGYKVIKDITDTIYQDDDDWMIA